jgi:hypothetical protein
MKSWTLRIAAVVCVVAGGAGQVEAQVTSRVHRATDPVTGAEVRVSQAAAGSIFMEIAAPGVTVTKHAANGVVSTVVRAAKDELRIDASRSSVVVSSGGRRVEATGARLERLKDVRAFIAQSPAARQAAVLLGRISLGHFSPLTLAILSTRNMLLGTSEVTAARQELGDAIGNAFSKVRAVTIAMQDRQGSSDSPTDCWNKYVREAISAWTEYEDCLESSGFWGDFACDILYDMRAIGAFTWWMKCVAIS